MAGVIYPSGASAPWVFLLVTVILGGTAAWTAGRAIARTWRSPILVPIYMLALAAAVHFLHYALFGERFFALHYYVVDYAALTIAAGLGHRRMRALQMVHQYGWSFAHKNLLFWREQARPDEDSPRAGTAGAP